MTEIVQTVCTATLSILLVSSVASCKRNVDAEHSSPHPAMTASASAGPSGQSHGFEPARLALDDPRGAAPVDLMIRSLQIAAQKSSRSDGWILLGRAWVRKARETNDPGFYLNAEACADVVLAENGADRLARGLKAQVSLNQHRFDEASDRAGEILAADPDDLLALGVRSDADLERGRVEEAERAVQHMLDLKPSLPSYIRASYLRWLHGDWKGAKQAARSAIDAGRDPRDPEPGAWAIVQAAMIFWHEGDYPGADAGFDQALQLFSEYPPALVGKGRVALARGDNDAAIRHLRRAFEQSPLAETAWLLGDALKESGDDAGAEEAYQRVLKIGRASDGRTLAAFLAAKNRNVDEALAAAQNERKHRGDIVTDDALAWALYRAGKYQDAKVASDRALRFNTPDMTLVYHAGAIAIALGQRVEGEKLVRRALDKNRAFDLFAAREAKALLVATTPAPTSSQRAPLL